MTNILADDEANYQSDNNSFIGDDNQSNNNSAIKSISQSKNILNNYNLYFALLLVLIVILGGFLIRKMKK